MLALFELPLRLFFFLAMAFVVNYDIVCQAPDGTLYHPMWVPAEVQPSTPNLSVAGVDFKIAGFTDTTCTCDPVVSYQSPILKDGDEEVLFPLPYLNPEGFSIRPSVPWTKPVHHLPGG